MKPVTIDQVLGLQQWERVRPLLRPLFIHEKERRRLPVGDHLTLLFENAQSVWYQVQEMIRSERMTDAPAIQHELDTYNELLPGADELSATLFIEYADNVERDAALRALVGLERHVWVRIADRRILGTFEEAQIGSDQVSSVQFVRFALERGESERFAQLAAAGEVALEVDHPALTASAQIGGLLARSLADDLREAFVSRE
ncbi:MAG TPA: DUF3501 family protein [Candidatus Dormibacteraeota bacterium]|nr:DUF3501 family protein [Candidatus Dormibacteraeota bacterium]